MLALTLSSDPEVLEWFSSDRDSLAYLHKAGVNAARPSRSIKNLLDDEKVPRVFIVMAGILSLWPNYKSSSLSRSHLPRLSY